MATHPEIKAAFLERWRNEYLHHLQTRSKWVKGTANLEVDTIVLLIEDNQPPYRWTLGKVTAVYPGEDGIVRVADVMTTRGVYRRSTRKLFALPFDS